MNHRRTPVKEKTKEFDGWHCPTEGGAVSSWHAMTTHCQAIA